MAILVRVGSRSNESVLFGFDDGDDADAATLALGLEHGGAAAAADPIGEAVQRFVDAHATTMLGAQRADARALAAALARAAREHAARWRGTRAPVSFVVPREASVRAVVELVHERVATCRALPATCDALVGAPGRRG